MGTDWLYHFLPATHYLINGNGLHPNIFNAPWVLFFLIPFSCLPLEIGMPLLLGTEIFVFGFVAWRLGAKPLAMGAFLLNPITFNAMMFGNIEWLVILGLVLPRPVGLLTLILKPQMTFVIILIWVFDAWQSSKLRGLVTLLSPTLLAMLLSFAVFGFWPERMLHYSSIIPPVMNLSFFPYSIPVGVGLSIAALRSHNIRFAYAASPALAPTLTTQSWVIAFLTTIQSVPETIAVTIAMWWVALLFPPAS